MAALAAAQAVAARADAHEGHEAGRRPDAQQPRQAGSAASERARARAGILAVKCGPVFAGLTAGTIVAYTAYTLGITQWRIQFRQAMNTADSEASARATDSLINYETVKYYGNEAHELRRYDECLAGAPRRAALRGQERATTGTCMFVMCEHAAAVAARAPAARAAERDERPARQSLGAHAAARAACW
jgi:hypothetical protein